MAEIKKSMINQVKHANQARFTEFKQNISKPKSQLMFNAHSTRDIMSEKPTNKMPGARGPSDMETEGVNTARINEEVLPSLIDKHVFGSLDQLSQPGPEEKESKHIKKPSTAGLPSRGL